MPLIPPSMRADLITLIASSEPISQPTDELKIVLLISNFTPPITDPTSPTPATFTGSTPKEAGLNDADVYVDPVTGIDYIQLKEPVGGWNWICTADPASPETVYGWMITNAAGSETYGSAKFATPIVINAAGQGIQIGQVRYSVPSILLQ